MLGPKKMSRHRPPPFLGLPSMSKTTCCVHVSAGVTTIETDMTLPSCGSTVVGSNVMNCLGDALRCAEPARQEPPSVRQRCPGIFNLFLYIFQFKIIPVTRQRSQQCLCKVPQHAGITLLHESLMACVLSMTEQSRERHQGRGWPCLC